MKKLIITSLALLSLSANSFAVVCVRETSNLDYIFSRYSNISIPQSVATINLADRVFQLSQAVSEVATRGPVQAGLGNTLIEDASQLERTINAKLSDNRALLEELQVAQIEMHYCLKNVQRTSCMDSVDKLAGFDRESLNLSRSIQLNGLDLKNLYYSLGEKLQALSRLGQSAQMGDFNPTLEKAQQLASKRDTYLNQVEQEMRVRNELSQTMKACLL